MKVLVTGGAGLVGSYSCIFFAKQGHEVIAVDNFMRGKIFDESGSTSGNADMLRKHFSNIKFHEIDIRDTEKLKPLIKGSDIIIHTAAQPSHPKSIEIPLEDFSINAYGTLNLLELTKKHADNAIFVFTSTNKVYGENPNRLRITEKETRYDYAEINGVDESMPLDNTMHTPFGVSKVAADLYCQEYAHLYGLKTGIFRLGCITGPMAKAVELHNWEPYFVKANIEGKTLNIYGFKGKQVRDVIDARDLVLAFEEFIKKPRAGEAYNMGGGRKNSISLLESFKIIESITGKPMKHMMKEAREGDHQVYISDLSKFKSHYPKWGIRIYLEEIFTDLYNSFTDKSFFEGMLKSEFE
ncbi:NAD-dependent epimerase/dehydratase family protein [Candidatus Woesearchaeota archaeon]|nr:NAD-dependent epimerase/dehydratase family protein [Candidatus Woesearchaeota archaeon]